MTLSFTFSDVTLCCQLKCQKNWSHSPVTQFTKVKISITHCCQTFNFSVQNEFWTLSQDNKDSFIINSCKSWFHVEVLSTDDNVERIMSTLAIVAAQRKIFYDIRQRYSKGDVTNRCQANIDFNETVYDIYFHNGVLIILLNGFVFLVCV